jgi:hypothetical protein
MDKASIALTIAIDVAHSVAETVHGGNAVLAHRVRVIIGTARIAPRILITRVARANPMDVARAGSVATVIAGARSHTVLACAVIVIVCGARVAIDALKRRRAHAKSQRVTRAMARARCGALAVLARRIVVAVCDARVAARARNVLVAVTVSSDNVATAVARARCAR